MRLPGLPVDVPGPRDLLGLVERAVGLLGAADRLLGDVDRLVARIEATRQAADALVARTEQTRASVDPLMGRLVVLLDSLEPSLAKLQPTLERLADTTTPEEVDALVGMIDHLPLLGQKLEEEIVPVLHSLGSVAPDLHDLLDTSRELNEMLAKMPGMGRLRRRVEEAQAERGV